jgi:hypothetical protein
MLLMSVGVDVGLEGSEVLNWLRMVDGEMESWKNCESEIVERAEARWLEKRDSAACLERSIACLDMFMDICRAFLPFKLWMLLLLAGPEEEAMRLWPPCMDPRGRILCWIPMIYVIIVDRNPWLGSGLRR